VPGGGGGGGGRPGAGGGGGGPTPPPGGGGPTPPPDGGGPTPPDGVPAVGGDAEAPTGEEGPPGAGMGMRCDLTEAAIDPDPGKGMATLSGIVAWEGELTGSVLIDIGRPGDLTPVYGFECRGTGAFSIPVPRALDEVVLLVFIDNDMDGPSATDAQARSEGAISLASDQEGLTLSPAVGTAISGATFATPHEE
jgi:hypothetical protein